MQTQALALTINPADWPANRNALPSTIDDLFQRGSPVVSRMGRRGTVTHLSSRGWHIVDDEPYDFGDPDRDEEPSGPGSSSGSGGTRPGIDPIWSLDLDNTNGQIHAVQWMARRADIYAGPLSMEFKTLHPDHSGWLLRTEKGVAWFVVGDFDVEMCRQHNIRYWRIASSPDNVIDAIRACAWAIVTGAR